MSGPTCSWCLLPGEFLSLVPLVDRRQVHYSCIPALLDDAGLTPEEREAMSEWVEMHRRVRDHGIDGILPDEDRKALHDRLTEMANQRRRVEAEGRAEPMA